MGKEKADYRMDNVCNTEMQNLEKKENYLIFLMPKFWGCNWTGNFAETCVS